ncbi:putative GPI-anchored protein [Sesamum alatum]|uniref:GPI-anchored protein n=1 Tax=Sesamum alatum TaxID=300844 RepID=A0AAE1Y787_9LAMI|nr:putative GPI-anchored protein [Sesamum alatum]
MESCWARFAIIILLLSVPVYSDDEEDHLLQGINSFRQSANAPVLAKHDKANCVADEIADQLEDKHCASNTAPPAQSQLISNYPSVLKKCKIDVNTTRDGMILPVCVPHRVATLVLTNYTQSQNSRYLNDSRFTGAGIGTEDDWTVLVLTTNTPGGSFASGAGRVTISGLSQYLPALFLMLFLALIY